MSSTIRPATTTDAPGIAKVLTEGFDSYREWMPADWEPPTDRPAAWPALCGEAGREDRCWVAVDSAEDRVSGFVRTATTSHAVTAGANDVVLRQLFVAPNHWGSGLAQSLLTAAMDAATADGFSEVWLATPAQARRARAFYVRSGFEMANTAFEEAMGFEVCLYRRKCAVSNTDEGA